MRIVNIAETRYMMEKKKEKNKDNSAA